MAFSDMPAVRLTNVTRRYGDLTAVDNLSLDIKKGEVLGLLGPNGSGKSTSMKMMYVPESPRVYEFLTALEFLDLTGDIYGMAPDAKKARIQEFVGAFDLEGREGDIISSYSDGMKQKVAIISALMHRPEFLIMDEPLRGLDPKSAKIVKDLLQELASQGVTTVISTHVMEIAQAMCDRIAIIYHGRLIAVGTMDEIRESAKMPGSGLEDIFLKLTGTGDVRPVVEALTR
jgi:ABC-2 type transport system ATP-binding protein